ncbi:hypothetical protein AP1H75_09950 [Apilactobacillus apinorum]
MFDDDNNKVDFIVKMVMGDEMFGKLQVLSECKKQSIEDLMYEMIDNGITKGYQQWIMEMAEEQELKNDEARVRKRRNSFKVVSVKKKE